MCHVTMSNSNKLLRELIVIFASLGLAVLIGIGVVQILLFRAQRKKITTDYDGTTWKLTSFHKFNFRDQYHIIQGLKEEK
jgi:hypothetical protein